MLPDILSIIVTVSRGIGSHLSANCLISDAHDENQTTGDTIKCSRMEMGIRSFEERVRTINDIKKITVAIRQYST